MLKECAWFSFLTQIVGFCISGRKEKKQRTRKKSENGKSGRHLLAASCSLVVRAPTMQSDGLCVFRAYDGYHEPIVVEFIGVKTRWLAIRLAEGASERGL